MLTLLLRHPHRTALVLGLFVLVAALGGCANIDMASIAEAIKEADSTVEVRDDREAGRDEGPRDDGYDDSATSARDEIVMYSLTTCGYCNARRQSFERQGIAFTEYFIDEDESRSREMWSKLSRAGKGGGRIGTPVLEVNGHMLPNNPSMDEIRAHLRETPDGGTWRLRRSKDDPFPGPTSAERELYARVNAYRQEHGLRPVPLSKSLTYVAQAHVRDLDAHPPEGSCNMHSWSSDGPWSACCYTPDHAAMRCMHRKPAELTHYTGSGYENAYRGPTTMPSSALRAWQRSSGHRALILNEGIWADNDWQAMGIGVHGSYAVLWFGSERDPDGYWRE
jgi:glutaredoxin